MRESKKLDKGNIEDIIALTPTQEGILFHYLKDPETGAYHEQLNLELVGNIDIRCFEAAWNFVIETNEMLRTLFRWEKVEHPIQIILKEHKIQSRYYDFSGKDANEKKKRLEEIKVKSRKEKFDLREVPFRVTLCKIDEEKYQLVISNHHILYDGWSNGIILEEFFSAYNDLAEGKPLKPLVKTKFKKFVKGMQKQDLKKQEKYWTNYLKDFTLSTGLSLKNKIKDRDPDKLAGTYSTNIPSPIRNDLHRFVKKVNITPTSLLYSALGILLQRYNNCDDVLLGTTVSGRSAKIKGIENMVGLFINTLPLRIQTLPNEKAIDLIYRIQEVLAQREEYERTSLVDIREYSELSTGNRGELFDVIVAVENYPLPKRIFQQNDHRPLTINSYSLVETTHYDLYIGIIVPDDMVVSVNYSKDYFNGTLIENMVNHFIRIVHCILQNPGIEIHKIELLSDEEKTHMIYNLNATSGDYPQNRTIHELFEEQVAKNPGQAAVVFGNNYLTYGELSQRSDQLAARLRDKGIKPGINVGLIVESSSELLIGLAAVLKAGGTYVPIDTAYPDKRIKSILRESDIGILLVNSQRGRIFDEYELIDLTEVKNHKYHKNNLSPLSDSRDLAYIIFTSGTTGEPKGVMIEHRSIINLFAGVTREIPFAQGESILSLASISFDIFVIETLLPLTTGVRIVMVSREDGLNPEKTAKTIEKQDITILQLTPSRVQLLLGEKTSFVLKKIAYLILTGEALPNWLLKKIRMFAGAQIYNMYGPTETTVWSSLKNVTTGSADIGKPFLNTRIYILGKENMLQPVGVPGELCIAGHGLARGYLNKPELTHERFKESEVKVKVEEEEAPFGQILNACGEGEVHELHELPRIGAPPNKNFLRGSRGRFLQKEPPGRRRQKIYKTGDLARWLPDGNIEFMGRIDHQLKIRGYRIEPGEIQHQLVNYQGIKDAVVIAKESPAKSNYLCAFIVLEHEIDLSELRRNLNASLPDYMIPGEFIRLEKVPVNSNGKVDRKALQSNRLPGTRLDTTVSYTAPGSEMEKIIADTWKEVLQREKVGIHDNFFDIGGNSFSIIRLNSRLKEIFNKDIPITDLFNYPTVASLAQHLYGGETRGENHFNYIDTREVKEFAGGRKEIAVIGMWGRFPGAKNIDEFWENLKNGVESIWFFSDNELELSGTAADYKNNLDYVKAKGVLEGIEFFDASFFEYTMSQAEFMDPQTRIFHECCWNALENAGYDPHAYKGLIGLYAGAAPNLGWEAQSLLIGLEAHHFLEQWEALQFRDKDYLSTRVSYKLNLKGPAVTVQTACSTSLAAIDMACQGLLTARCDIALAGGVCITLHDQTGYLYQEGMIMSRDGHCRTFDERATGTVNGNGAAVVVLKPLKEAEADRDFIYAVIKGSAVNNDGTRKVGFTAPSIEGQAEAIGAALRMATVEAESISYLETHGTGTILGDPIEIEALKLAFQSKKKGFCGIGSIKTNIGHLDAAAGVVGFIKTALALKHRLIPPSLHFETLNPKITPNSPFYVNRQLTPWKKDKYPLRAGVSSFGIGGTNVHMVLEEAPTETRDKEGTRGLAPLINAETSKEYQIILLSARSESVLKKMTGNLTRHFKNNPGINLADAAYTLQVGRKAMACRSMLVCSSPEEVVEKIQSGEMETGQAKEEKSAVIFMFSGQGSQYVNMGLDLYQQESVFRHQVDRCFELLEKITGKNMKPVLYPGLHPESREINKAEEKIYQFLYTTPIKFIFEYSLAVLLMKWGIQPRAMIGHSFGEYVCACISGVFSLEDGLFLSALRGELMHGLPEGAMLSVPLSEEDLKPLLPDKLSLAAVNGPSMCVVSGPVIAIEQFEAKLNEKGHECLRYRVPKAGHSRMVEPIMAEFKEKIAALRFHKPKIPYISGMTGTWITAEQVVDPGYWTQHLRQPVRFADGLTTLFKEPDPVFIQVGPGRGLTLFVRQHPDKKPGSLTLNLVRHKKEKETDVYYILEKIGQLWLKGIPIHWPAFYFGQKRCRIPLPAYPFEGQQYSTDADVRQIDKEVSTGDATLRKKSNIVDWFYVPTWIRTGAPQKKREINTTGAGHHFLVFIDRCHLGTLLIKALEQTGKITTVVKAGSGFTRENERSYIISHGNREDYKMLFNELQRSDRLPQTVVHLYNASRPDIDEGKLDIELKQERVNRAQHLGLYSLLYMVQAIAGIPIAHPLEIKVVTTNVQEVTGDEIIHPEKSTILGAVKTIPQEYREISCSSIDITLPASGDLAGHPIVQQLLREVTGQSSDTVIAYRGNHRWVQTFVPLELEKSKLRPSILKEGGVYLVTGGTGTLGLILAEHLAREFRAKLVLTAHTPFPDRTGWDNWLQTYGQAGEISRKILKIRHLEQLGAEIEVMKADAADIRQMRPVIDRVRERFGRINGVIHSAGNVKSFLESIAETTENHCQQQFQAKIYGLLVLEELLKDQEIDFCLLMSSISSILGGLGFAAYSSANIFMDYFAQWHNRRHSTRWISVDWDNWQTGQKQDTARVNFTGEGLYPWSIKPEEGQELFDYIFSPGEITGNLPQVIVSTSDLQARVEKWIKLKISDNRGNDETREKILPARRGLTNEYAAPRSEMQQQLISLWQEFFGKEQVGIDDDFFELGGDSFKAIVLASKIHQNFHVKVPLKKLFETPTIRGLARYIRETVKDVYIPPQAAEKKEYYELSINQKRLWIIKQCDAGDSSYNITGKIVFNSRMDENIIKKTLTAIMTRHESLRTGFIEVKGEPVQRIAPGVEIPFTFMDLSSGEEAEKEEKKEEILHRESVTPFSFSRPPLFRVLLLKTAEDFYEFIFVMHHIISDGWSMELLEKEFFRFYRAYQSGEPIESEPLELQYKDYTRWLNKQLWEPAVKEKSHRFWSKRLEQGFPVLNLPRDFSGKTAGKECAGYRSVIPLEMKNRLKRLANRNDTSLFMIMFTAFNIFLSYLGDQKDIVCGISSAGRDHIFTRHIVGFFLNPLVLRNHVEREERFIDFLHRVNKEMLEVMQHQLYPLELVLDDMKMKYPEIPVFFNMLNMRVDMVTEPLHNLESHHLEQVNDAKFHMNLYVIEYKNGIEIKWNYKKNLFKPSTFEYIVNQYINLLDRVTREPGQTIDNYRLFCAGDLQLRGNRVKPVNDYAGFKNETGSQSAVGRFEEQVRKNPGKVAVKTRTTAITYDCLNSYCNRVAHTILKTCQTAGRSDKPRQIFTVALLLGHDVEMIAAVIGTLKAGKIYVPLDPAYPLQRLAYMLKDSDAFLLITTTDYYHLAVKLKENLGKKLLIIDISALDEKTADHNPAVPVTPGKPAYILYTSGSTGKPKGVIQNQRNLLHFARLYTNSIHICAGDKLTLFSSYSFDAAKMDIYGALLNGAALYPYDLKIPENLSRLPRWLQEEGITIYHSIPTVYRYFTHMLTPAHRLDKLRLIVLGGEMVLKKDIDAYKAYFSSDCMFINGLGPTESTVTLQYFINKDTVINREMVPVGYPVGEETEVFLLDENNREVPVFGSGEIVYKSPYLALGYLNRQQQTREAFGVDPLTENGRVYRSGDLGRRLPDGSIEFLGRKDFQVKVGGYRIEPGEIEGSLDKIEGIAKSAVICRQTREEEKFLAAYYMTMTDEGSDGDSQVDENTLIEALKKELPPYMIPRVFGKLETFPLTPTGKIDRSALAQLPSSTFGNFSRVKKYTAPRNQQEEKLTSIWWEILNTGKEPRQIPGEPLPPGPARCPAIGIDDNFFVIGGNSLKAIILVSDIHKAFNVKIRLADVFQFPTIRELARCLVGEEKDLYQTPVPVEKREYYPQSSAQRRLFFLDRFEEIGTSYNMSYMFIAKGKIDRLRFKNTFAALINRHETLRTSFFIKDNEPVQQVHEEVEFEIEYDQVEVKVKVEEEEGTRGLAPLSMPATAISNPQPITALISSFIRPFDLSHTPLLRVGLIKMKEKTYLLMVDMHHIAADGISTGLCIKDFAALYQGKELAPLKISYKDFACWQNLEKEKNSLEEQEKYWLNMFSGELPTLNLPTDYPRSDQYNHEGDIIFFTLKEKLGRGLKELAEKEKTTMFTILLTIICILFAKICRQRDLVIGTPVAGRRHVDIQHVIGFFVNTLALRNFPKADKTFTGFLYEVRERTIQAFDNQDYPFEELANQLKVERSVGRNPLFDVVFTFQNIEVLPGHVPGIEISDLILKPYNHKRKTSPFDLAILAYETGDTLAFSFLYRTGLFKKDTINRLIKYLEDIITSVLENQHTTIGDIKIASHLLDQKLEIPQIDFTF